MNPVGLDYAASRAPGRRLVVLWVAAVAALVAFVVYVSANPIPRRPPPGAYRVSAMSDVNSLCVMLEAFRQDVGRLPTDVEGLAALYEPPRGAAGWNGPYINRERWPLNDPWGRPYIYRARPVDDDHEGFHVLSTGADGAEGTADDIMVYTRY